jgi:excisionase family DNA binding protein
MKSRFPPTLFPPPSSPAPILFDSLFFSSRIAGSRSWRNRPLKPKLDASATLDGSNLKEVLVELRAIRKALSVNSAAALPRAEAATYLGVSVPTLERLTASGAISSTRVSAGRVVWLRKALDKYLESLS